MRKILPTVLAIAVMVPALSFAQKGGAFVGSLGIGLTAAQDNFADDYYFSAGSGFGFEGEIRYYLWSGFAIGVFGNYMRFGSSYPSVEGRLSFNFSQLGGLGRMNLIRLSNGRIYLTGGGGIFTPNAHFYIPDNPIDEPGRERGYFGFGGIGLMSSPDMRTLYELEIKYNVARADYTLENIYSNVWDFIYVGVKLSFASKGKEPPPRY